MEVTLATTVATTTSAEDTAWAGSLAKVRTVEAVGPSEVRTEEGRILEVDRTAVADSRSTSDVSFVDLVDVAYSAVRLGDRQNGREGSWIRKNSEITEPRRC